jgi:hypothetical protein
MQIMEGKDGIPCLPCLLPLYALVENTVADHAEVIAGSSCDRNQLLVAERADGFMVELELVGLDALVHRAGTQSKR